MSATAQEKAGSNDTSREMVAGAALAVLHQCESFIRAVADGVFAADSQVIRGGTAGKHVRHTLDHFSAALAGAYGTTIDYDHRERNVPMETDRGAALSEIGRIRADLARLGGADLAQPVRVRVMLSGEGAEAVLDSTLARELAFATHHAVHHHAMMKAIALEFGATLPADFGKAPSTINHERTLRH